MVITSLVFIFTSCEKPTKHQPGEPDVEGCYGVYFPSQKTSITLDPSDPTVATITVARTNTTGAITVPYTFTDTTNIVTCSEIVFADGQSETTCNLSFSNAEVGVSYICNFIITDPLYASKYNNQPIAMDLTIMRDKWNSLGMAKFKDSWMFDNTYEAELIQNDKNTNLFRLLDPYTEGLKAEGYYPDYYKHGPSPYIEFLLLKKGNTLAGQTITTSGLVYFQTYYSGFYNTTYNDEVKMYHPSAFKKYSSEGNWLFNKVLQYQDNGLPAGIQLAPFIYMDNNGGWDKTQSDGIITIVFPGAVLTDYTLKLAAGLSNDGTLPVKFTIGADVKETKYAIYEGSLNVAQIEKRVGEISDGTEKNTKSVTASGIEGIVLDKTGVYTLIAVTFDGEKTAKDFANVEFSYVAKGDTKPVVISTGLTSTNKFEPLGYNSDVALEYYIFGKDVTAVKVALFKTKDVVTKYDACVAALLNEKKIDAETLANINDKGFSSAFVKLSPGTEYTVLVWATNNYESKVISASSKTTGKLEVKIEDMIGNYNASVVSFFDGPATTTFAIAKSDKAESGDIMFTKFANITCQFPIYATLDLDNNKIIVPDYQKFFYWKKYEGNLYFVTYDGSKATTFDITNIGAFGSPSGMFGIHVVGGSMDDKTYDAFTAVDAVRVEESTSSSVPAFLTPRQGDFGDGSVTTIYRPDMKIQGAFESKSVSISTVRFSQKSFDFFNNQPISLSELN